MPGQEGEQRELPRGQLELDVSAPGPPRRRVEPQVAGLELGRALPGTTSGDGPQPGHEHRERERLGQVVVRAGVEPLDLVPLAVLGGEHQDRRPVLLGAQRLADLVAVDPGQHQVEHDRVVGVLPGQPQPVGPVVRHVDGEALGLEPDPQRRREPHLVVDDEHSHRLLLWADQRSRDGHSRRTLPEARLKRTRLGMDCPRPGVECRHGPALPQRPQTSGDRRPRRRQPVARALRPVHRVLHDPGRHHDRVGRDAGDHRRPRRRGELGRLGDQRLPARVRRPGADHRPAR